VKTRWERVLRIISSVGKSKGRKVRPQSYLTRVAHATNMTAHERGPRNKDWRKGRASRPAADPKKKNHAKLEGKRRATRNSRRLC